MKRRIKNFLEKLSISGKRINYKLYKQPTRPQQVFLRIPYYSQWESKNLVNEILAEKLPAQKDPRWKRSGATTPEEYAIWSWSGCGMACLKMILKDRLNREYPLVELGKMCMEHGGYKDNSSKYNTKQILDQGKALPSNYLEGLFYEPFLKFIKQEFNLAGRIVKPMIIEDITLALSAKDYVIASVNASIRDAKSIPPNKGGHLVLVTGFDLDKKMLYINNPSGLYAKSQEYYPISFTDFEKFFAHRGVIIHS